jgi:hypothetical protein
MNNGSNLEFHVGSFGDNRWIALTLGSPYLGLEAESKEALLGKLKRLVAFTSKVNIQLGLYMARTTQQFQATQIILARELEDA